MAVAPDGKAPGLLQRAIAKLGNVILYSPRQMGLIREAAKIVSECLALARDLAVPGSTTRIMEQAIAANIRKYGATSPFLGYQLPGNVPFPATCLRVGERHRGPRHPR